MESDHSQSKPSFRILVYLRETDSCVFGTSSEHKTSARQE
jgi:hypothetical protein